MNIKKTVLFIASISSFLVLTLFFAESDSCYLNPFCNDTFLVLFLLPPPFLFLSLITYRLKDEVFTAWWSFARWWVPVIIITTIYFETAGGGGGGWGMSSGMDEFLVLSLLYIIFIITSLVKIVRAYTRAK